METAKHEGIQYSEWIRNTHFYLDRYWYFIGCGQWITNGRTDRFLKVKERIEQETGKYGRSIEEIKEGNESIYGGMVALERSGEFD